jgi:diguanylate cyclase (GGDEF)-like protein/PAS domain S-box-containing protein
VSPDFSVGVDTQWQMVLSVPSARPRVSSSALKSAIVVLIAAGWIAALSTQWSGIGGPLAVSDYGLAAAALAAGVGCTMTARRAAGRARLVWGCLAASACSWGLGQCVWTWYEVVQGRDVPFPSLADVGYLGAVPLAAAGLLLLPAGSQTWAGRVRTLIDGLMIAGSALLTSWVIVLSKVFAQGGDPFSHGISLAYPIGDVVVVTIVLYVLLRARQQRVSHGIPIGLIGLALVAMAFSDSGFTYLTATSQYSSGNLIDIGWFMGYVLLLLAALRPAAHVLRESANLSESKPLGVLLPYVAVGIALATSSLELATSGQVDPFVSWTRTAIIVAMVVRQVLTLLENRSLTGRLRARLHDLRASEQRFEALVQHSSDVVTVVDVEGTVTYQSESILRVFGHDAESLTGTCLADVFEPRSGERLLHALSEVAAERQGVRVLELEVRHATGRLCHAEMTMTNLLENPSVGGVVLNTRDMSERKVLQDQLVHEASHDSLTALANRALFRDRVEKVLRQNDGRPAKLTVLFLDLDGFKEVNDSLGHATGDMLLIQVAERLRSCVRPIDTVARLGGDEFAVLIADKSSERDGTAVANRITRALREPFKLEGREIEVGASIGIAATDQDVDDADHLLRNADLAMYRAKGTGAGGFERYHPRLHVALVERLQLEAELRQALAAEELELHYQPTLSLATGEIQGLEALARWKHRRRGFISPAEFIPLAEQTGLIRRLGRFGLHEACRQLTEWRRAFPCYDHLTVSVNISGRHLEDASLIDDIQDVLAESELPADRLVLEMTESVLMDHTEENVELLARLKELGVGLAIDDFGTGYSSLAYLHRFPADVIKIDRSFVERLEGSESDAELLRTIVQLGQSLRMVTVAEGVETAEQAFALNQMGCELAQGFHFHRALTPEELQQVLASSAGAERPRRRAAA